MQFKYGSYGYLACSDMEYAKDFLDHPKASVYYSQQACEKILKHYLQLKVRDERIREILKSHKVQKLAVISGISELKEYRVELIEMQEFYFDGRYPSDDYIEPTMEDACRILKSAEAIFNVIENKIKEMTSENSIEESESRTTSYFKG